MTYKKSSQQIKQTLNKTLNKIRQNPKHNLGLVLVVMLSIATLGSLFTFSLSGLSVQSETTQTHNSISSNILKVKTLTLKTQENNAETINFDGKITNETEIRISAATSATVKSVNFTRGKAVKKGDVLVTLGGKNGPHPLSLQVAQAQTNLNNLDTNLENLGNSNNNNVARAKLQIETTQKALDDLKKTYDLTKESTKITLESSQQALINLDADIARQEEVVKANSDQVNASIESQKTSSKAFIEQSSTGLINSLSSLLPIMPNSAQQIQSQINALNGFKTVDVNNIQNHLSDYQSTLNGVTNFVQATTEASGVNPASVQTLSVISTTAGTYRAQATSQLSSLNTSSVNQRSGTIQGVNSLESLKSKRVDLQIALDKARNGTQIQEQATLAQINNTTQQIQNVQLLLDAAQIGAQTQTDSTEGQRKLLELQLQTTQTQLSALTITSPISGIITDVKIVPNQDVSPGLELVTVYGTGGKFVRAYLKPKDVSKLKVDDVVDLNLSGDDKTSGQAKITMIYPVADNNTGLVPIDLEISQENTTNIFVPGASIQGEFKINSNNTKSTVLVPTNAISIEENKKYIWVLDSKKARKQEITTGVGNGDQTEIATGLKGDEEIILTELSNLKEGQEVNI